MTPRELSNFCFRRFYEDSETTFTSIEAKRKVAPAFVIDDSLAYRLEGTEFQDWSTWAPAGRYYLKSVYLDGLARKLKETNGRFMRGLFVILNRYNFRTTAIVFNNRIEAIAYSNSPKAEGMGKLLLEDLTCTFDETWTRAIDAWPSLGVNIWSCSSNEWFGMRKILHEYIGLQADLPLLGKIQHGWQPNMCAGINGEQGYSEEVNHIGAPVYVWSTACLNNAVGKGLHATAVGCPWLYMREEPWPEKRQGLLAFPTHSFDHAFRAKLNWTAYANELREIASSNGFSNVTISVHTEDYSAEVEGFLRGQGFNVVTLGTTRADDFWYRARRLIRSHVAVTSDRLCSSAFYSLYENVPFFVAGSTIAMEPEEPVLFSSASDREWARIEFPELLKYTGVAHKNYADVELGLENKRSPAELRGILYGWAGL